MERQLEPPLREAIAFLEVQGYRYAVIGGIAVTTWGTIRATRDVDLKVLVPDLDYAAVRTAIRAAFPEPGRPHAPDNPQWAANELRSAGPTIPSRSASPG